MDAVGNSNSGEIGAIVSRKEWWGGGGGEGI
jgi:hypothetical protein